MLIFRIFQYFTKFPTIIKRLFQNIFRCSFHAFIAVFIPGEIVHISITKMIPQRPHTDTKKHNNRPQTDKKIITKKKEKKGPHTDRSKPTTNK